MATINRQTALLLDRVNAISDRLSRLDPGPGTASSDRDRRSEAPDAAAEPPSAAPIERDKPPPATVNAENAQADQLVHRTVQIVMAKIQPLLEALEKIRLEHSAPRQPTDTEYIAKMCEDMGKRIALRRGFVARIQHKESQS